MKTLYPFPGDTIDDTILAAIALSERSQGEDVRFNFNGYDMTVDRDTDPALAAKAYASRQPVAKSDLARKPPPPPSDGTSAPVIVRRFRPR